MRKQVTSKLPSFQGYGPYSGNYGTHALRFDDPAGNTFWFSYQTMVAFRKGRGEIIVHQNDWGPITGKHLNAIDGGVKKFRLSEVDFHTRFEKEFG